MNDRARSDIFRQPLLRVEELRGPHLGPVSLALCRGECVLLSGVSGAGKSMLLRALADLDGSTGRVWLEDRPREALPAPAWRRQVALLPAESAWWAPTVGAHFPDQQPRNVAELGFEPDVTGWSVERLSSGERQRLALLRLLANEPRVLLLDEPTANLDPDSAARAEGLILRYIESANAAALWVSHDAQQGERIARRGLRMESGQLVSSTPN